VRPRRTAPSASALPYRGFRETLLQIGLLALSCLLFALSFPSFLSDRGWFPLGFLCLVPVFIVLHRCRWIAVVVYGFVFGLGSYALFAFWLGKFHPLTLIIVPLIFAVLYLPTFPILKAVDRLFPRYGFILQSCLWVCYEYFLKTNGFTAFSYGSLGYSQYAFLPLIRIASVTGVWGVSLLVVFPSAYLGNALKDGWRGFGASLRGTRIAAFIYAAVFAAALIFGLATKSDLSGARPWKVAMIQHNIDPWWGGFPSYQEGLDRLIRLSTEALKEKPDLVAWSETAFVPAIDWHTRYRPDNETYSLVKRLIGFLEEQEVPFLFGNDDGRLARTDEGEVRVDYNAAILFDKGRIVDTYRKIHLVPFTEHFPYRRTFPGIYDALRNTDTHFWEKGTQYTVFQAAGTKFSTPICFEDTFGYLCRNFFRNGAEVLVNLTNDAWSFSVPAAVQHMAMAVFRAVENKRSVVRSTNGGFTCVIDPNGKIEASIPPFQTTYLVAAVPVYTRETTLYLLWGDWFPWALLAGSAVAVLFLLARRKRAASIDTAGKLGDNTAGQGRAGDEIGR
jgi:apolipoprotein N-acyltransferase